MLARGVLGSALGALAIDAELPDVEVLALCEDAVAQSIAVGSSDDARHKAVSTKLLRLAVQEVSLSSPDPMAMCRKLLSDIRAAFSLADVCAAFEGVTRAIDGAVLP